MSPAHLQSPSNELVLDVPQGTAVIFQRKVRREGGREEGEEGGREGGEEGGREGGEERGREGGRKKREGGSTEGREERGMEGGEERRREEGGRREEKMGMRREGEEKKCLKGVNESKNTIQMHYISNLLRLTFVSLTLVNRRTFYHLIF